MPLTSGVDTPARVVSHRDTLRDSPLSAAGSPAGCAERRVSRAAGPRAGYFVKPVGSALDGDRGGGRDVLQVRPGQAAVGGAAPAQGADPLRERLLDVRAAAVLGSELGRRLSPACRPMLPA